MPDPMPATTVSTPRPAAPRAALLLLAIAMLTPALAGAIEEAPFEVVRRYPAFELRQYGPTLAAETTVTGDFDGVGNKAFLTLADFIGGRNSDRTKIAMTAPVLQTPATDAGPPDRYLFAFVMPPTFTSATLPQPVDPRVRVRQVPPRLMAVHRYSGSWSQARYRQEEAVLLDAVREAGLKPVGVPVFARYNSPFALWFMRRNEVMVEVDRIAPDRPEAAEAAGPAPARP